MNETTGIQKAIIDEAAQQGQLNVLAGYLQQHRGNGKLTEWYGGCGYKGDDDAVENAKLIITRTQHFSDWSAYENFKAEANNAGSKIAQFEQAADAIVSGDVAMLKKLLAQNPGLITMRSVRNHHSTLLNYVGANGFEGYRQKTPLNAVEIAAILLNAGAEVDARGDMYRGTTTLGLVATSAHPVRAGVQEPLMDILIQHGANPNRAVAPDYTGGNLILACLHNGRYEPVNYLADKGADVELEGAGGVGDVEKVKTCFNDEGELKDPQLTGSRDGCLIWACVCGHLPIVEFLFKHGCSINTVWDNTTALHSAAYGGQLELVEWLLEKGAPMEVLNEYGGTVLATTLWALYNNRKPGHLAVMEMLIAAGAEIKDNWQVYIDEVRNS